jgi:tetratricopeptide (TPR) repeat protein
MSDYRDLIRVAMFESVQNDTFDISLPKKRIEEVLDQYSTRLPEFKLKEKINLELVVPIQLPPDGKRGDCKAVVEAVRDEFIELSGGVENGGATLFLATGSWVSALHGVEVDRCLIVYTAMPIRSWFEAIPKLRLLIRDEIQTKLCQQCVFMRIDNNTYGDPVNLLANSAELPPGSEFGPVDTSCYTLVLEEYQEPTIKTADSQTAAGDNNIQIQSNGNVSAASGANSMAAAGNINFQQTYSGVAPEKVADMIAEERVKYLLLKQRLDVVKNERDEDIQKRAAIEALRRFEELKNSSIVFDGWELLDLGDAAALSGRTNTAHQYYSRGLNTFREDGDRQGEANSLNNLGIIAGMRGDLAEAERLHRASLTIKREIGNRRGEAASLNNLGNIADTRGDLAEAERLHRASLAIKREVGDRQGEAASLNNLGNIADTRGDLAEAERLYRASLAIEREVGDRQGEANSLNNLGIIAVMRGDLAEAERLHRASLAIEREIGNRQGEANSLNNLGNIADTRGDLAEAERLHRESQAIRKEIGLPIEDE